MLSKARLPRGRLPSPTAPPHLPGCPRVSQAGPSGQRGTGTHIGTALTPTPSRRVSAGVATHTHTHTRTALAPGTPAGPPLRPHSARSGASSWGDRRAPPTPAAAPTWWAPERMALTRGGSSGAAGGGSCGGRWRARGRRGGRHGSEARELGAGLGGAGPRLDGGAGAARAARNPLRPLSSFPPAARPAPRSAGQQPRGTSLGAPA